MHSERNGKRAAHHGAVTREVQSAPRLIDSAVLLGKQQSVQIRHGSGIYTLRQTRQGKLILTK